MVSKTKDTFQAENEVLNSFVSLWFLTKSVPICTNQPPIRRSEIWFPAPLGCMLKCPWVRHWTPVCECVWMVTIKCKSIYHLWHYLLGWGGVLVPFVCLFVSTMERMLAPFSWAKEEPIKFWSGFKSTNYCTPLLTLHDRAEHLALAEVCAFQVSVLQL